MRLLKTIIILFLLQSLIFSCSNETEKIESETKNLLISFHNKNEKSQETKQELEILIFKKIDKKLSAVFYNTKTNNNFYVGFISNNEKILKVIQLDKRDNVSIFDNSICSINDNGVENDICFTLFAGEIPYEGYSSITLDWNCSKKTSTNEELVKNKYFFFLKKGKELNICNIKFITKEGKVENFDYKISEGIFDKQL
jgi:hypothetical protein